MSEPNACRVLLSRYDKKKIAQLPVASFPGRVIEVRSELDARKAVDYLLRQPILGFDTETKPTFTAGHSHKVALLQVSSHDICFLFRLTMIGLPESVLRLLTDTQVTKVGLSWGDDLRSLHKRGDFECAPFVELQTMASEMGIKDMSLQKLYANVFGERISKTQQLSNWENEHYNEAQRLYAATDAWACIRLYEEMQRLRESGNFEIEEVPAPEPPQPKSIMDQPVPSPTKKAKPKISSKRRYWRKKKEKKDNKKTADVQKSVS